MGLTPPPPFERCSKKLHNWRRMASLMKRWWRCCLHLGSVPCRGTPWPCCCRPLIVEKPSSCVYHGKSGTLSLCHQREYWWSLIIVFYGGLHLLPDGGAILDAWPWLGRRRWYVWDMDNCLKILWQITLSHSRYLEKYANLWDGSLLGWSVA